MVEGEERASFDDAGPGRKPKRVRTNEKPTEYDVELLDAAEYGRDEEVAALLSHGANFKAKSKTRETALHLGARYGHKTSVELILKANEAAAGEDAQKLNFINAQDDDGWTALYGACLNGHDGVVQVILERGAKIDTKTKNGWTALQKACQENYKGVVELLLKHELDVELQNSDGETAFHIAARNGRPAMAELLLNHGVNINARDNDGWTALYSAAHEGHKETVDLLLQNKLNVNAAANDGWTASHTACQKGYKEILKSIVGYKADLTLKTSQGETSLHVAARNGRSTLIELLLKADAALEARDNDGWTPLYSASHAGHAESVELLLSRHADMDARTKDMWTALHAAAHKGHREVVQILLKHGAAIDAVTKQDSTTMHLAAAEGHRLVIIELLKYLDDIGKAEALQNAALRGDYIVFSEVLNDNYDIIEAQKYVDGTFLFIAASNGKWDVVRLLLEQVPTADFGGKDVVEEKTLIWAAKNDEKMVKQLLSRKVTNVKVFKYGVTDSWTALHLGAFHGHSLVIYWLLANGASAAIRDRDGYTPQMVADKMSKCEGKELWPEKAKDQNKSGVPEQEREKKRGLINDEGKDKEKAGPSQEDKYKLSLDILENPPVIQGRSESGTLFNAPALKRNSAEEIVCKEWEATIIDFSVRTQRVDLLRRSRSIYDVIYKDGPEKIMSTAKNELTQLRKDLVSDEKNKENFDSIEDSDTTPDTNSEESDSNSNDTTDDETSPNSSNSSDTSDSSSDSEDDCQFRWVHLPANNMTWMEDLLTRTCLDQKIKKNDYHQLSKFLRYSWYELPGRASHSRLMKPACVNNASRVSKSKGGTGRTRKSSSSQKGSKLALYMPYLTFATLPHNLTPKQKHHEYPAGVDANRRHQALMAAYQGKVVHASQTLDQFYYHSLSNTNERDLDQVVTRYIEGTKQKDKWSANLTILRVDQLWLWVVDNKTIITSSTHRRDDQEDPVLERIFNYLREESGKRQGQPPPTSVDDMSKFIVNLCVGFIDQYTTNVRNTQESAQQIFAKSINEKAAEEAKLFHDFTRKIDSKLPDLGIPRDEDDKQDWIQTPFKETDHDAIGNDKIATKYAFQEDKRHISIKPQTTGPYASISVATHLLEEVKDIRDELNILKSLLKHQKTVWDDLFKVYAKNDRRRSPDYAMEEIEEMDRSAKRIQDSVNSLLSLDQNEANISEAQETTRQGRTLMIFTIVTIIFLPLSFLATLFTLNVASYPHESGVVLYQPEWIFPILFGTTVAISIPLILFAFKAKTVLSLFRRNIDKARIRTPTASMRSQTKSKEDSLSINKPDTSQSTTEISDAEKMNPHSRGKEKSTIETKHFDHNQWNGTRIWRDIRRKKGDKDTPADDALV